MQVETMEEEFTRMCDTLESLIGIKYLGVRTSTQLKLGSTGVAIIIEALTGARHCQDEGV